jgi:DNA polymerase-3 subunit delta'
MVYFKDIIGQERAIRRLTYEARRGRLPHALLMEGAEGVGKLALAVALARYLVCAQPSEHDGCGHCAACRMMDKLAHPDVHFVFPVVKRGKETTCSDFLPQWREQLGESAYFGLPTWLTRMGSADGQAGILVKESDTLARVLSLKASQGGWRVVIIWLPERMNAECANKLLKLFEEPPAQVLFVLVSEEPDALLPTIRSRTQRLFIPPIAEDEVARALMVRYGIQEADAQTIGHYAGGNWLKAVEAISLDEEKGLYLELFIALMRMAYARRIRELKEWSEGAAAMGRERQKHFLAYCGRMLRENFASNFGLPAVVHMDIHEREFSARFAPFVNEANIIGLMEEFSEAERHIGQNVNARMVFFDLALKTIVLLVKK